MGQHEYGFYVALRSGTAPALAMPYLRFRSADRFGTTLGSPEAFVAEMRDAVSRAESIDILNGKVFSQIDFTNKVKYDGPDTGWIVEHAPGELCLALECRLRFRNRFRQGSNPRESVRYARVEYLGQQILGVPERAAPFPAGIDHAAIDVRSARVVAYRRDCTGPVEVSPVSVEF